MAKKRSVKVYGRSGYKYRETPTIMLKGLWLEEVGFDIGDYISVTCEDGKITLITAILGAEHFGGRSGISSPMMNFS